MSQTITNNRIGAASVAMQIHTMIADGSYGVYERLPSERALCEIYHVSRGTIRGALLQLEKKGMIEIRPGSGAYVVFDKKLMGHDIIRNARPLELIDARFALEPHICRLAILHGQPADFDRLETHINHMIENADDPREFSIADAAFHLDLARSTGNSLLIAIISQINDVRKHKQWAKMRRTTLNSDMINTYNNQHHMILAALRDRDSEGVTLLMKDHLGTARRSLTLAIEA